MVRKSDPLLSVVVPIYNEALGLPHFHDSLITVLEDLVPNAYEIIYCDDGSTDNSADLVRQWHAQSAYIKLISFSRNFGKENALSAGIAEASGDAIIMVDADGQYPVELIPDFFKAWQAGAQVVVGVRKANSHEGFVKRYGSKLFYYAFNKLSEQHLIPGSTDFRLIDKAVQTAFLSLGENDRMTRGLIDWLGFTRELIYFTAHPRVYGKARYDRRKLVKLAKTSLVSLSPTPLYLFGYFGVLITIGAFLLGLAVLVEQLLLGDPWHWRFTGTAMLGILILFLVGIVLLSQGILSLYISHIHTQSKQRPLYIINDARSAGLHKRISRV